MNEAEIGASIVGIGIDAVDVDRLRTVMARRPGIEARIFTDGERRDARQAIDPAERFAARFAAKEAVMKALGHGLGAFSLRDVEVVRSNDPGSRRGAPGLRLGAGAAKLATEKRVARWHISLTHTDRLAMAMVVAESGPRS